MKFNYLIFIISLTLLSFISKEPIGVYYRNAYDRLEIKADHFFHSKLSGGCDGSIETKGKWKVNKDTLIFIDIESRMMDDPWKRSEGQYKYLIKKDRLAAFSIVDGKIVMDENAVYIRGKK